MRENESPRKRHGKTLHPRNVHSYSRAIAFGMKNTSFKQITARLAVIVLLSLLAACATTASPQASKAPRIASRDSSGPVRNPDIILPSTRIPVTTYYDWPPIGDNPPR